MKSLELTKPITTESLLAEFESRFNQTMDLSQYTKEELDDLNIMPEDCTYESEQDGTCGYGLTPPQP